MTNLKFMDLVPQIWGLIFRMAYFSAFGFEMFILEIEAIKKTYLIKPLVVGTARAKRQDTPPESMTTEQLKRRPNLVKHCVQMIEIRISSKSLFYIFFLTE